MNSKSIFFLCLLFFMGLSFQGTSQIDHSEFDLTLKLAIRDTGGGGATSRPPVQGDRDGGGVNSNSIYAYWPKTGKIAPTKYSFTWSDLLEGPYVFNIVSSTDGNIYRSVVKGNSLEVDFGAINVKEGNKYNVFVENLAKTKKSNPTSFSLASMVSMDTDMQVLMEDERYNSSSEMDQKLMKAFYLEDKGWNLDAEKEYHIKSQSPQKMALILKLYNDFLARS